VASPVPSLLALRHFSSLMEEATFRQAKSKRNPHAYTLRRTWADPVAFEWCVDFVTRFGAMDHFPPIASGWVYTVLHANGWKYWSMGEGARSAELINRKPADYDRGFVSRSVKPGEIRAYLAGYEPRTADERVADRLPSLRGKHVVEVGAGEGRLFDRRPDELSPDYYTGLETSAALCESFAALHPSYRERLIRARLEDYTRAGADVVVALGGMASYVVPTCWRRLGELLAGGGGYCLSFFRSPHTNPEVYRFPVATALDALQPEQVEECGPFVVCSGGV
jgi:hypothetical protein